MLYILPQGLVIHVDNITPTYYVHQKDYLIPLLITILLTSINVLQGVKYMQCINPVRDAIHLIKKKE